MQYRFRLGQQLERVASHSSAPAAHAPRCTKVQRYSSGRRITSTTLNSSLRPASFLSTNVAVVEVVDSPSQVPNLDPTRYILFRELLELGLVPDGEQLKQRIQDLDSLLACNSAFTVMQLLRQEPLLMTLPRAVVTERFLQLRQALPRANLDVILQHKPSLLLEQDVFKAVGRRRPAASA